jgi:hypothetical protein
MKRIGIFLLACVYIFSTTGTVLDIHYCMGHISGVHWDGFGSRVVPCGPGGMHCCRTESKVLKLADVHQPAAAHTLILAVPAVPHQPLCLLQSGLFPVSTGPVSVAHAPPPDAHFPLFIRYCSYRI